MHGKDKRGDKCCSPYREEEPLSGAGLEELLPLVGVPHGEGDGVDPVLELGRDGARPLVQLQAKQHVTFFMRRKRLNGLLKRLSERGRKRVRKGHDKQSLS